ncbi:7145_t:CDS:1, partial [Racocetra fulgida]
TELSKQVQEFAQQCLETKQQYVKVFGFVKALINKAVKLNLNKKILTMLDNFKKKEIDTVLTNSDAIISLDESKYEQENKVKKMQKRKSSEVSGKNPIVKHQKGCLQKEPEFSVVLRLASIYQQVQNLKILLVHIAMKLFIILEVAKKSLMMLILRNNLKQVK